MQSLMHEIGQSLQGKLTPYHVRRQVLFFKTAKKQLPSGVGIDLLYSPINGGRRLCVFLRDYPGWIGVISVDRDGNVSVEDPPLETVGRREAKTIH